ncbi:MAG: hypothetical protein O9324_06920 [Microcystis sp. LE19-84.1B]|uniref:hypothetical protein n=1 Tax=Microcystis sp. LE19-84.1B TaxID=3016438 RepID=UPI0022C60BE1|nr:hypothetical protein [Microcystis sp. LE19-84.1B]MCZ8223684.1 hypothetical protein [Microcystis sp. LE19-84.1B]
MSIIEIHEFSTGVKVQSSQVGTQVLWWVEDYTEEDFMNCTLEPIPDVVYQAIDEELLKIPCFPKSLNPQKFVIIGREVKNKKEAWSIIAVISKGKDRNREEVLLYRYFIAQGLGKLTDLLAWFNTNNKPTFDPFDQKYIGQPHLYDDSNTRHNDALTREQFKPLLEEKNPCLVIPHDLTCTVIMINQLAERRKNKNKLTAWAYQIEEIYKPQTFQAIYPLNSDAENYLRKKVSQKFKPKLFNNLLGFISKFYQLMTHPIKVPLLLCVGIFFVGGTLISFPACFVLFAGFSWSIVFIIGILIMFSLGFYLGGSS